MKRLFTVVAVASALASCDPVHTDQIDALGDEAPGVRKGPTHRPGQPCLVCHDGALGDPPEFAVAGTVYVNNTDKEAAQNATVTLTSADGAMHTTTTNEVGNFYITPQEWSPVYPMKVGVTYQGTVVPMTSHVGRDGSCATCHFDPAGPASPGHVYIPVGGVTP